MAGIQLTFSNVVQLISALAPILITFFFLMLSLFNQNVKGIIYIAGALLAIVINLFLMNQIKSPIDANASYICNIIDIPILTKYNNPSANSLFIAFTIAYMLLPMIYNNEMNFAVISALSVLFVLDGLTRVTHKCTNIAGTILGGLVGFLFGAIWYTIFHSLGYDKLLYFNEVSSNNVVCSKPSKQTFKCKVYKNGEIINSYTA